MEEAPLTRPWKLGCGVCAVIITVVASWLIYTWVVLSHDKSINSRLSQLWDDPQGVPLGLVQPMNNRWMKRAFVADASAEDGKKVAVLILDDHYWSDDRTYRSKSGLIGDRISTPVLCSVPAQARRKNVPVDPVVQSLIAAQCR